MGKTNLTGAALLRQTFRGLKGAFAAQEIVLPEAVRVQMTSLDDGRSHDHELNYRRALVVADGMHPWVICLGQNGRGQSVVSLAADLMALGYFNGDPEEDLAGQIIDRLLTVTCSSHSLICARQDSILLVPDDSIYLERVWPAIEQAMQGHIAQHQQPFVDIPEQTCRECSQQTMLYRPALVEYMTRALHQILQTPPEI